ncbi:MAG TPA: tripartite tricarboxylate transporter substrate binding protein [Burkholderiales bacterium]|nr:tripartite tricarboxylate transporter substrate binding protein [Burkholderiales bacterium]
MIRALLLAVAAVLPSTGFSQAYPTKPVKMIIPFAPGGASDFVGRIFQPKLSDILGQSIVIENRAGASGNIGMDAAAKSPPDGYTIYLGNVGTVAINPGVFPKLAVVPTRDFIAVTQVVDVPGVLVANPELQANSLKDVIAIARAYPGKLNYASPGSGSQNRLEMELVRRAYGLDMVHVPYKGGAGPAVAGLIAGETHLMFTTVSSAMTGIQNGRLRPLVVVAGKRLAALPNVPTMVELGHPDSNSGSWQGIFVPAGTPNAVVERLFPAVQQALKAPEVVERLGKGGVEVVLSASPEAFAKFVAADTQRWAKVAKESGATVD